MSSPTVGPLVDVIRTQVRHMPSVQRVGAVTGVAGLIIESEGPNVGLGEICTVRSQRTDFSVRAEVVGLPRCLERLRRSFHPVFTETYVAEKLHEAAAEGAAVVRADGIVAVRARGSSEVGELLVLDAVLAMAPPGAVAEMQVALRTIMSYPAAIGLFCSVDV